MINYKMLAGGICEWFGIPLVKKIILHDSMLERGAYALYRYESFTIEIYRRQSAFALTYYLSHELRHHWQFVNYPELYLYWINNPVGLRERLECPDMCPIEIDARRFGYLVATTGSYRHVLQRGVPPELVEQQILGRVYKQVYLSC